MLRVDDIDRYIVSPNEGLVCLQNDTDSACLTLVPEDRGEAGSINAPSSTFIQEDSFTYSIMKVRKLCVQKG